MSSDLSSPSSSSHAQDVDASIFIPRPLVILDNPSQNSPHGLISSSLDLLLRLDTETEADHAKRLAAYKQVLLHFSGGDDDECDLDALLRSASGSSLDLQRSASTSGSGSDVEDAVSDPSGQKRDAGVSEMARKEIAQLGALSDREKMFLSAEQIVRILSREKWDAGRAIDTLTAQIQWRRTEALDDGADAVSRMAEELNSEARSGKNLTYSFDTFGRPLIWTTPSLESPDAIAGHHQVRHSVFVTERAIDLMPPGVEQMVLVIDLSGQVKRDRKTVGVMRTLVGIMQSQYRERVAAIHVRNVPWIQKALVSLLWPFVDSSVRSKVTFDSAGPVHQLPGMDAGSLPRDRWQGQLPFQYQYPAYWQAVTQTCEEKRRSEEKAWKALGGRVGLAEREWRVDIGAKGLE